MWLVSRKCFVWNTAELNLSRWTTCSLICTCSQTAQSSAFLLACCSCARPASNAHTKPALSVLDQSIYHLLLSRHVDDNCVYIRWHLEWPGSWRGVYIYVVFSGKGVVMCKPLPNGWECICACVCVCVCMLGHNVGEKIHIIWGTKVTSKILPVTCCSTCSLKGSWNTFFFKL